MRGLYAIADTEALARRGIPVQSFVEAVLDARPAAIQLRDKTNGARAQLAMLREIAPLAARAGVPLFANDRPDLALLARCDGVHVGQDDVPVGLVRRIAGSALAVGISTHDADQIDAAIAEDPDYLAIGPVFATSSKDRPSPVVGIERLRTLATRARDAMGSRRGALQSKRCPIVAIGGITIEHAAEVGAIVDCVAVIGALLPLDSAPGADLSHLLDAVRKQASALHSAIIGAPEVRIAQSGGDA